MKPVFAGILGLVLGAAAAAALVYVNPLTADGGAPAAPAAPADGWQLAWEFPGDGVLTHTHGGALTSALRPADAPELWEETIRSSVLTSLRLDDARDGTAAWATRISVPSTRTNLLLNGVVVGDYWLISKPGEGALFMRAHTNVWPALKDTYVRVDVLRRPWAGPAAYSPTLRPADGPAVQGATGTFAGREGSGRERIEIGRYSAGGRLESLSGRLTLDLGAQPATAPAAAGAAAE